MLLMVQLPVECDTNSPIVYQIMSQRHLDELAKALNQHGWKIIAQHAGDEKRISGSWEIQRTTNSFTLCICVRDFRPDICSKACITDILSLPSSQCLPRQARVRAWRPASTRPKTPGSKFG